MFERLKWADHETARQLADLAERGNAEARDRLADLTRRVHPEMGERFVCPGGFTVERVKGAILAWRKTT